MSSSSGVREGRSVQPVRPRRGLSYWGEVAELTAVGALARAADILWLLPRPRLLYAYLQILAVHLWRTPYRWPSGFEAVRVRSAAQVSEHELVYGETPVFSAWWILRRAGLEPGERVVDLTAGRGRPMLGARLLTSSVSCCELIGERALPSARFLESVGINVELGDGSARDLSNTDVAMVTWTGFSDSLVARFERVARTLPDGGRFVAVDRPMTDLDGFEHVSKLSVLCSWGIVPVWIYVRRLDSIRANE